MKKVLLLILSACVLAGMPSCKKAMRNMINDMTAPEIEDNSKPIDDVKTLNEAKELLLTKGSDNTMPINFISMYETEEFTGKTDIVNVCYMNEDKSQTFSQKYFFDGEVSALDNAIDRASAAPLDLKNLDMNMIAKGIEEAKTMIPEGYTYRLVNNITIKDGITKLTLSVTKDGEETITSGGQTSEVYYQANYEIDNATGAATDKN